VSITSQERELYRRRRTGVKARRREEGKKGKEAES
jgi:hypothetical protein